ncbi:MAG: c-type cytochrome [Xanthobacteraceae bacterium]
MRGILAFCLLVCGCLAASAQSLQERLPTCLACHGESGQSANADVPSLGGQPQPYLLVQLVMFREKMRKVELMNEMVKGLSDDDLRKAADTLAKLPPPKPLDDAGDAARMAHAQALATQNKCNFCHQANYAGLDNVPRIASQREDYLARTLREYKSGTRTGYDQAMLDVVAGIDDAQIADLAYYLARAK